MGADPTALGHVLETFVVSELLKSLPLQEQQWQLYHWRDKEQREVDILAEAPGRVLALFRMKASTSVTPGDIKHLRWFFSNGPGSAYNGCGFVVYLGDRVATMGDGMVALPLSLFWSCKAGGLAGPQKTR